MKSLDEQNNLVKAQAQVKETKVAGASTPEQTSSREKRGFIRRLKSSFNTRRYAVGDWLSLILVKWHPTKSLKKIKEDARLLRSSKLFNSRWYRSKYKKHIRPSQDAINHYLKEGAALGFNPSDSFNTQGYLELYPDVAAAKINPLVHYLRSGKHEKRVPTASSCTDVVNTTLRDCASKFSRIDDSRKTVLLVTHEMSRTGAPIILLNIAKEFKKKSNVIILTLKSGGLVNEFTDACDLLLGPTFSPEHLRSEVFLTKLFERILSEHSITFAVVNSIVSHVALKPLWKNEVPSIHLIHEFASYTRPQGLFGQSAFYSSLQIFCTGIVRDNAIIDCPAIRTGRSIILPQGINRAPGTRNAPELASEEMKRIRETFRPIGFPKNTVVIVGIGTVQMRKGVDLFIACAKRVAEKQPLTPFRFVWIGHGYDPVNDEYSLYLTDQILRSGLDHIVAITKEVAEIETAHQQSDILFLSSRLDPLPLVSQDSMANGKPVVCFERATGIAEYLAEDSDAAFGVVPYLDIEESANRIFRLIDDTSYRKQVGEACRKLAASRFCFESYVSRIENIGLQLAAEKKVEKEDRDLILQSNIFRKDFYCSPTHLQTAEDPLRQYMSACHSGIISRKPFPGFHPGVYGECNGLNNRDALGHYIQQGQPDGPWRNKVIEEDQPVAIETSLRVGLHLHLYFPDLAKDIFERLKNVQTRMDLLISVPSEEVARQIKRGATQCARAKLDIRIVPNRGRDIGPFLTEFRENILTDYDIIGHLHTKKSINLEERTFVKNWADFLYENLLGGTSKMADTIIRRLATDSTIGLVFPDDPHVIDWGENQDYAIALAKRLNIADFLPKTAINFPIGTMFWAKTAALRPLLELGLQWDDYPPEPLPYDGSILHAIERMLPIIAESCGYTNSVSHVSGITR